MRLNTLLAAVAMALAAMTAGCTTFSGADLTSTVNALAAAGCSGTIENIVTAQTAAGVSPGSASISHKFTGTCDPAKAVRPAAAPATSP